MTENFYIHLLYWLFLIQFFNIIHIISLHTLLYTFSLIFSTWTTPGFSLVLSHWVSYPGGCWCGVCTLGAEWTFSHTAHTPSPGSASLGPSSREWLSSRASWTEPSQRTPSHTRYTWGHKTWCQHPASDVLGTRLTKVLSDLLKGLSHTVGLDVWVPVLLPAVAFPTHLALERLQAHVLVHVLLEILCFIEPLITAVSTFKHSLN